jgi:hypothetical protein
MTDPEYADLSTAAEFVRRIVDNRIEGPDALRVGLARNQIARAASKARIHARQAARPDIQALANDLVASCMAKLDELEGRNLLDRWIQRAHDFEKNLEAYEKATL